MTATGVVLTDNKTNKRREKRERRRVKHALIKKVMKNHFSKEYLLCHTDRQIKVDSKRIAEQILSGKNPSIVEKI